MARTPTVYRWDDPGAPELSTMYPTNKDRDLMYFHTVLKACLVTGYGAKAAAGWTMPLEETTATGNRFVLTNAANSGSLLYEGGTFSGGGSYNVDTLWACSAVPDMDSPVNAWSWNVKYADRNSQGSSGVFHKSGLQIKYTADAWVVIANENTCIVIAGRAAAEFSTSSLSVPGGSSCMFIFGVMYDGFGNMLSPQPGNFYIAGGAFGSFSGSRAGGVMHGGGLTSNQDIIGLAKNGPHIYNYKPPSFTRTYVVDSALLPVPVVYSQRGGSSPIGSFPGVEHFSVCVPSYRTLLFQPWGIEDLNYFMEAVVFSGYGSEFEYEGGRWIVVKSADDVAALFSLAPAEWGA